MCGGGGGVCVERIQRIAESWLLLFSEERRESPFDLLQPTSSSFVTVRNENFKWNKENQQHKKREKEHSMPPAYNPTTWSDRSLLAFVSVKESNQSE